MSLGKLFKEKNTAAISQQENIKIAEEEILQAFSDFLESYKSNSLDFNNLNESQIAILNATPLGIKLPLEEGQSFEVKKVTTSRVYITYYQKGLKHSGSYKKIVLKNNFTKSYLWSDFTNFNLDIKDINVPKAVFNLSQDTGINIFIKNESDIKKLLKPLVKRIKTQLDDFIYNLNDDFECDTIHILNKDKIVV